MLKKILLPFFIITILFVPLTSLTAPNDYDLVTPPPPEYGPDSYDLTHSEEAPNDTLELTPEDIPQPEYSKAKIIRIDDENTHEVAEHYTEEYQQFTAQILSGKEKGKEVSITIAGIKGIDNIVFHKVGEKIVVVKTYMVDGNTHYDYADNYRMSAIFIIFLIFIGSVLILGKWKGLGSLLGLFFSILILSLFIVPQIAAGKNPIVVTIVGSLIIMLVSLYLAHGFNKKTTLALFSTLITLSISVVMAQIFVHLASLFGLGSEEAFFLQIGEYGGINLQGLLLAGIIIGTLGVLDDITTAQTAVVGELRIANPNLSKHELHKRALVVGKEHISSLVNTLVLAYAGVSLPLFFTFSADGSAPFWYSFNSQYISEEVVRTLIGSLSLILAVPISTYIAAHFLSKADIEHIRKEEFENHHH